MLLYEHAQPQVNLVVYRSERECQGPEAKCFVYNVFFCSDPVSHWTSKYFSRKIVFGPRLAVDRVKKTLSNACFLLQFFAPHSCADPVEDFVGCHLFFFEPRFALEVLAKSSDAFRTHNCHTVTDHTEIQPFAAY